MMLTLRQPILLTLVTLLGLILTSWSASAQVDSVTASVDKNPVMADESIVLSVVAIGTPDPNAFDPSVLSDDFFIGRTSTSSQTRVINFDTTRSTTWTTVLIPRKEGSFTIPAFQIEGKSTQPISIRVIPASDASSSNVRDAFVTAQVDINQPYVQQQITYTVKIHLAVELQRGSLANPEVSGAEIKKLGEDKRYSDIVDGQRYTIIERNYAIIPQTSGELTIKGPLFEAEIIDRSRNSFSYFNQTRPINRVSPEVTLNVQPIPSTFTQPWLPSEFVQLNEEWQPDLADIKVGEPITRTLTLSVLGVAEEQLPEMQGIYPPGFKVYPDQATTASVVRDGRLIAQRVENIAIIPNREGQFVLPPVKVAWFNTLTQTTEYAELPAKSIQVAPATNAQSSQVAPAVPPITTEQPNLSESPQALTPTIKTIEVPRFWSASSWMLLLLWLMTLIIWFWHSQHYKNPKATPSPEGDTEAEQWRVLKQAVKSQGPGQIYAALQKWKTALHQATGPSIDVEHLVQQQPNLQAQIDAMLASEYAQGDNHWKSGTLLEELTRFRSNILTQQKDVHGLRPLYNNA
ncbi:BatD family protein [Aliiglaciecola litoralis]|uniref:DUF7939 domain-containing protein n=1 Tax=Aliiglaciecola litoralis TaxID=582857 RepID=A0ABN1LDI0_9ALTE